MEQSEARANHETLTIVPEAYGLRAPSASACHPPSWFDVIPVTFFPNCRLSGLGSSAGLRLRVTRSLLASKAANVEGGAAIINGDCSVVIVEYLQVIMILAGLLSALHANIYTS